MIDFSDIPDTLKELVQDYKIKVVDIKRLTDTSVFQTDVRQVFDFIRFAEKKKDLYELVNSDSYYQNMEEDAFEVLVKYANIKEGTIKMADYRGKDGKMNMCKGIRDLMEDSKAEGREEGRLEGRNLGVEQERRNIVINMLEMNKDIKEICAIVRCDTEYVQKIIQDIEEK